MTIRVQNFNMNRGGAPAVNQFSDSFNRGSGGPGQNWVDHVCQNRLPFATPFGFIQDQIGSCTDAAQGLIWSYNGQGAPAYIAPTVLICQSLWATCWGVTQFSQVKFIAEINPSGTNEAGPAVLIDPAASATLSSNQPTYYGLAFENNTSPYVARYVNTTRTIVIATVAGGAPVIGDIYRLSATPVAGATVLTVTKNGTVVNTFTDGVNSLITGSPGMFGFAMATTGQIQLRNYVGGKGL